MSVSDLPRNQREPAELSTADVNAALARIASRDPELARDAEHVYESLTWGEGPAMLRQAGVQDWLWYRLPTKYLTDEVGYMARLAETAAVFFDELGLHRYASLCRSRTTASVQAAYDRSDSAGRTALRKAMESSGVEPPDVDHLVWGSIMGFEESTARTVAEDALEAAIASGDLAVGARGWRTRQREITDAALDAHHPSLPGQSWRTAVLTERLESWVDRAERHTKSVGDLRARVANALLHPIETPDQARAGVQSLRWLLDAFGEEQPLTQAGNLKPALVRSLHEDAPWEQPLPDMEPPRTEADDIVLHRLRAWLETVGALRKRKSRLHRTRLGTSMATDWRVAWDVLTSGIARPGWDRFVIDTAALVMIDRGDEVDEDELMVFVADAAGDLGWVTSGDGGRRAPSARDVSYSFRETLALLRACDLVIELGDWRDSRVALTELGRTAMLTSLRHDATGPRGSP